MPEAGEVQQPKPEDNESAADQAQLTPKEVMDRTIDEYSKKFPEPSEKTAVHQQSKADNPIRRVLSWFKGPGGAAEANSAGKVSQEQPQESSSEAADPAPQEPAKETENQ